MSLFVDTSVWSLALRRDGPPHGAEVTRLVQALRSGELVLSTGLVLQELLQGFHGPRDRDAILDRISAIPFITPDRQDHIEAAGLRNRCRRNGIQVGTIDTLFAQLCVRHDLQILTADADFTNIARHSALLVWGA